MAKGEKDEPKEVPARFQPSMIRNKQKRLDVAGKLKAEKKKEKKRRTKKRREEEQAALERGEEPPPKAVPRTIENTREEDETAVRGDDEELFADDAVDEFADHFSRDRTPKVLITTNSHPSKISYVFISELLSVIPNCHFYSRNGYHIKKIVEYASNRDFTSLIVVNEDQKKPNGLLLINLPQGPTASFKISNLVLRKNIKRHGRPTSHLPELILNNFSTRLGHRVGRLIASLFPQDPQFRGRRVVTFHNQRDFIFFRHHRYIFESLEDEEESAKAGEEAKSTKGAKEKPKKRKQSSKGEGGDQPTTTTRLQECGPRFTLKLLSLQKGTFDTKHGEFEWVQKKEVSRRKFAL